MRARIAAAAATAGRDPAGLTLIAITKTHPAEDVRHLAALGVHDLGENRDQEAAPKASACADLPLTWHFVGQLQSNKAGSVVRYADVVHSVDRAKLVRALSAAAARRDPGAAPLTCLIQVDLDPTPDPARGGADPADVPALAEAIAAAPGLRLGGLMAVAPLGEPARPAFGRLHRLAETLRQAHPDATIISAGMSGDLEDAIAEGATHLRVGTALLGSRPPLR